MHQRQPSTTPDIGFSATSTRFHGLTTWPNGKITGVTKIAKRIKNGTMNRTSRNSTFNAASQMPTLSATASPSSTNSGSIQIIGEGGTRYTAIKNAMNNN